MQAAAKTSLSKLPEPEAQNATNMLQRPAGAKLGDAHVTDAAAEAGLQRADAFTPQDASNTS